MSHIVYNKKVPRGDTDNIYTVGLSRIKLKSLFTKAVHEFMCFAQTLCDTLTACYRGECQRQECVNAKRRVAELQRDLELQTKQLKYG